MRLLKNRTWHGLSCDYREFEDTILVATTRKYTLDDNESLNNCLLKANGYYGDNIPIDFSLL